MHTFSGYKVKYIKHGGFWTVWDKENMTQLAKVEQIGVLLHHKNGVLGHGVNSTAFRRAANICQSRLRTHFRYLIFTAYDSEELLNQLISDKLAVSLLFHRDDLQDILRGSRN
jgi:hypothetical protein